MATILIADDDENIRNVLKEYSIINGYDVIEAVDGIDALNKVNNNDIDLIILDIMMPKLDGFSAYKRIKEVKDVPVLVLSAKGEEYDKLYGFEIGIDDYVVKPFSPREVMARVKAILARHTSNVKSNIYHNGSLKIDFDAREAYINDKKLDLTPKEYELLAYLAQNEGIALSRETILENVWGYDFFGDNRTVDTHIKMLRNSLGSGKEIISTVRGYGYKLEKKDEE
jgi:DNA-binding response OmpR family regulator